MVRDKKQPWLKPLRKELSGTQKKKAKKDMEEKAAVLRKQSKKFFQNSSKAKSFQQPSTKESEGFRDTFSKSNSENSATLQETDFETSETLSKSAATSSVLIDETEKSPDVTGDSNIKTSCEAGDPATWPNVLTSQYRTELILRGPQQLVKAFYPSNQSGSFSSKFYTGQKRNNEAYQREWLLFSVTKNALFCFPCCIFSKNGSEKSENPWCNHGDLAVGYSDFHNTKRGICRHESSHTHVESSRLWKTFIFNHSKGNSINSQNESIFILEEKRWVGVLKGILEAILFLAENNLAFRGNSSQLGEPGCGNFLNLIQLLSKFYPPLTEHVLRIKKVSLQYLSPLIQNEFITLCGSHVKSNILAKIRQRKYFSIMFDSTPDCAHVEQISQIVRSVSCGKSGCIIEENFIDFIASDEKTGHDIAQLIIKKLESDDLDIGNCRGQSYDNGSNMSGKCKGVQKWLKDINPLAYFIACAAHSLNLVGVNAAERVFEAKLILGKLQNVYKYFASSPKRWTLVREKMKCNLKGESTTRWAARANAVSALSQQYHTVVELLLQIMSSNEYNSETVADAESRFRDIFNFKFLFGITIWEHILFRFQICNNALQQNGLAVTDAEKHLSGLLAWLQSFRITGFQISYEDAKRKAEFVDLSLDTGFENVRSTRGRRPKLMGEVSEDLVVTNAKRFEIKFFNELLDNLISEINQRFVQVRECVSKFCFLWGANSQDADFSSIQKQAKVLCDEYVDDLDEHSLVLETQALKTAIEPFLTSSDTCGPLEVLNILYKVGLESTFPNVDVALRIFLTLPITVASNERAFSRLKLIKNYLRSSMGQERLTNLAILSIERESTKEIDFDVIIGKFAASKVRKVSIL